MSAGVAVPVRTARPGAVRARLAGDVWVRRLGGVVVAGVAAYASYQHQRAFALEAGAGVDLAMLWPLLVDGLLGGGDAGAVEVW